MKNYKVQAIRNFRDSNEIDEKTGLKIERTINDEFYCTKERYEFLKQNNAVKLVEIIEELKIISKETKPIKIEEINVEDLSIDPYKDFKVKEEKSKKIPEMVYETDNSKVIVGNNEIKFEVNDIIEIKEEKPKTKRTTKKISKK